MFNFNSLRSKIVLILVIPTISMFYFSSKFMYENYTKQKNAIEIKEHIQIIKQLSALIHELQKERGLSAAYLGKETKDTKNALINQRQITDKIIEQYKEFYLNLPADITMDKSKEIMERLHQLKAYRILIENKSTTFEQEVNFFSKTIKKIIDNIPTQENESSNQNIINELNSIQNLIYLKEYAGIERAYLSNIFEEDTISIKQLKDIQKIYIQQQLYYKSFIKYLDKKIYLEYKNKISDKFDIKLNIFRDILLKSNKTENFGIDGLIWYQLSTQRINAINDILSQLLNRVEKTVNIHQKEATNALLFSIILWILSMFAFIFIWYILYKMIKLEENTITKLEYQQKSYSAISKITNSISYVDSEEELYRNLSKTLIDIDNFNIVWIATVDSKKEVLKPILSENIELHKLEKINFNINNEIKHHKILPTPSKAYIEDKHIIHNSSDIAMLYSQCQGILDENIKAIASFPIYLDKQIVSILTIMSHETVDIFDIQTIELIEKLLKDTATSLKFLHIRENEKRVIEELNIASYAFESQEAMTITDTNAQIIKVNRAFEEITGYKESEVIGKNPNVLKSQKQPQEFYSKMWNDLKKYGKWKGEIYNKRKNGEIYPEMLSITAIKNNQGETTHYLAQFLDISDIKNLQKDAEFRAEHDPLTALTNRAKLKDETQKAFLDGKKQHRQHAFFFLDIDNFKYINDFYGHATGDEILKEIANRLKMCAKESDTVSRLGGDEFALLSTDIGVEEMESIQQATQIAKIIQKNMKDPIVVDGHPFEVTFSIGVKIFPNHENGYEEVISHADIAMYKAKKSGKNNFAFFDTELEIELKQFSLLEKEIKKALSNKEFTLYYQPKVDVKTNKIIGMEALVRWSHPTKGILPPNAFLQIVTDTKNMYILETLLIEQILKQISIWRENNKEYNYTVAINITPESFQNDEFIPFLKNTIKKYDIDASLLELELLENTFVSDMSKAISKIQILKAIGVKFAIDDFGTGYSSLTYLQKLPIDSIKIDKSFIMDIENQSNREIVKMIINFAKLFNLKVVAEGVENIKTLEFLQEFECDFYQGYFYSRPIDAKQIESELF